MLIACDFCVPKFHPKDQSINFVKKNLEDAGIGRFGWRTHQDNIQAVSDLHYQFMIVYVTGQVWFECLNLHEISLDHRESHVQEINEWPGFQLLL